MPDVGDTKLKIRVIHAEVKTYLKHKHGLPLINHDQDISVNVIKRGINSEFICFKTPQIFFKGTILKKAKEF